MLLVNPYISFSASDGSTVFGDDFDDDVIDPALWTASNSADITVAETGGRMTFTVDSAYSDQTEALLKSVPVLNFTGKTVTVDIAAMPFTGSSSGAMELRIVNNSNLDSYVYCSMGVGGIFFYRRNNGDETGLDATWDTFEKIRIKHNLDSTIEFSTYKTGAWTVQLTSDPIDWSPAACGIWLGTFIFGPSGTSKVAIFDNLVTDITF
jgi:hypothetical protein